MFDIKFIILFFAFLLAIFLSFRFIFKKRKVFKESEEVESKTEVNEYEHAAQVFESENKDDGGDDIRDIYNKKTKGQYQPKNRRGTDIEVAGFESKKDLKALQKADLNTIDEEDLQEAVEEKAEIIAETAKKALESGIASEQGAFQTTLLEVKQNYLAKGETSARTNFAHTVKAVKEQHEKNSGRGGI